MSDDNLRDKPLSGEDIELLEAVDRLDPEFEPGVRPFAETLGLLPYALDELMPGDEVKESLMASVARARAPMPAGDPAPASGRLVALERRTRLLVPMAAALAIALLGIAALQFRQLQSQQTTIDELSAQLGQLEQNGVELAEIRRALSEQRSRMRMMTTRGAEYCVLKPVGDSPRFPRATAIMVIGPDRDQWYLTAEGLGPCAEEVCYQLWFITEAESVWAASFGAGAGGERIEVSGERDGVPEGVRAISITRAAEGEPSESPETVLLADQAMTLL